MALQITWAPIEKNEVMFSVNSGESQTVNMNPWWQNVLNSAGEGFKASIGWRGPVMIPTGAIDESGVATSWEINGAELERFYSAGFSFQGAFAGGHDLIRMVDVNGRQIGRVGYSLRDDGKAFWTVANIAKGVITAGAATMADTAASSASTAATSSTGATMNFDGLDYGSFDAADYSTAFESYDFTTGESLQAFSDAQNVDYGFGFADYTGDPYNATGGAIDAAESTPFYEWGTTPESGVSDFGSVSYGPFGQDAMDFAQQQAVKAITNKAITAAIKPAQSSPANAGSGSMSLKTVTGGVNDIVSTLGNVRNLFSGTAQQKTTAAKQTYAGQLQASPKTAISPVLIIGGVIAGGLAIWAISRKGA